MKLLENILTLYFQKHIFLNKNYSIIIIYENFFVYNIINIDNNIKYIITSKRLNIIPIIIIIIFIY